MVLYYVKNQALSILRKEIIHSLQHVFGRIFLLGLFLKLLMVSPLNFAMRMKLFKVIMNWLVDFSDLFIVLLDLVNLIYEGFLQFIVVKFFKFGLL